MTKGRVITIVTLMFLLMVLLMGNAVAQNRTKNHNKLKILFSQAFFEKIVEFGYVDKFVPDKYIVLNDIGITIPYRTPIFDERGNILGTIPEGSYAGIVREPGRGKIIAIIKLSREKIREIVSKRQ